MATYQYFLLIFSIAGGGLMAFYFRNQIRQYLQIILSFSGAYIVGITALHLIPETFEGNTGNGLGLWLLLGFFGQLLLDQLSTGVEHGHIHAAHNANTSFAVKIMIGLCIHSFIEGMPLNASVATETNDPQHQHLFWGIILHEVPASFALSSLLLISGFSRKIVLMCMSVYASMSSLGALTIQFLQPDVFISKILMAVVIGSFLHISTTILFEADSAHHISLRKLIAIMLGLSIAIFTLL
ncbi:MAG: ZIP family metal transporter [Saprospiraceae bacterium]